MTTDKACGCVTIAMPNTVVHVKAGDSALPVISGRIFYCPLHSSAERMREALEKCEASIRNMACRLAKEPDKEVAVRLWLSLADQATKALASARGEGEK